MRCQRLLIAMFLSSFLLVAHGDDEKVDPCFKDYVDKGTAKRELHVNLGKNAVRVYTRTATGSTYVEYKNIVFGPTTKEMAKDAGWCHLHTVSAKLSGPTPKHGLLHFAVFCPKREIGFHSDHHMVNGKKVPIPGNVSAGCIRIPDDKVKQFFDSIQEGDCVRLYEQKDLWREPVFAKGSTSDNCEKK